MKHINFFKQNILLLAVFLVGFVGTVIFFPVNINDRYTCLFHRLTMPESTTITPGTNHKTTDTLLTDPGNSVIKADREQEMTEWLHYHLHHRYMSTFSYVWWSSLLLLIVSGFAIRRQIRKSTKTEPARIHLPKFDIKSGNE